MSNIPISSLPLATSLDGSETMPIVQGGTTKRATVNQITSDAGLNFVRSDGGVSALGNVAFFTNTTSTRIGASPLYRSGNPANAALFSSVPNRTLGLTQTFNGVQFSQGSPISAANQGGQNILGLQQALVGTISLAAGDTRAGIGVAGYAESNSADPANAIGIFGQAQCNVAGGSIFGGNLIAQNIANSAAHGLDTNFLCALEVNANKWKKADGTNPAVNHFIGLIVQGGGNHTDDSGTAIQINNSAAGAPTRWATGLELTAGSCLVGLSLGPSGLGNSQGSQSIIMTGTDSVGAAKPFSIFADASGSGYLIPSSNTPLLLLDGNGQVLLATQAIGIVGGNTGVTFPQLAAAGVITNAAGGVLSSSPTLSASRGGFGTDISASSGVPLFAAGVPTFTGTTGTGAFVRAAAPTFTAGITVTTNVASGTFNNVNIVAPGSTAALTLASAKTLAVNNTLTLNGTDGTSFTFPTTNATLARTDAGQTFTGTQVFSSTITGNISGNAATVTTNANLTGDVTSVGNATTLTNAPVIAKVLTGFASAAGTVAATDSILQAMQKLGGLVDNAAWTAYTPTVTAGSGTPTLVAAAGLYKRIGKTVFFTITVTVTTKGTAASSMKATLPFTANTVASFYVKSFDNNTGASGGGSIFIGAPTLVGVFKYDATTWWADGANIGITGEYEAP